MVCSHHHYRLHALLYTRKTDSWRELAVLNGDIEKLNPIKSRCENGHFAHWHVVPRLKSSHPELILSLDMKNEVFQTIRLLSFGPRHTDVILACTYFAEDEHSFWHFDLPHSSTNTVTIYRSSEVRYGVGRVLFWNLVTNVVNPFYRKDFYEPPQWTITDCVVFECWMNVFMYDYRARKYDYRPRKYDARKYDYRDNNAFSKFKHTCSFVLLENVS
ncbi:hypothetical protein SASPL_153668 [Salvia splendens]|uniref:F-box associated domain-containing protein n=1 Tax=Salvia splendens TaxID=180675 RepID=A0A8X8VYU1_SALSN|nr:hypothetical protein SASPL_153668 [Salvia splendens]